MRPLLIDIYCSIVYHYCYVLIPYKSIIMAGVAGFEPTTYGFGDRRSATELHPYMSKILSTLIYILL